MVLFASQGHDQTVKAHEHQSPCLGVWGPWRMWNVAQGCCLSVD
jgi:hypothetical protein